MVNHSLENQLVSVCNKIHETDYLFISIDFLSLIPISFGNTKSKKHEI